MVDRLKNVGWVFVGAIVLYWGITTLVGTVWGGPLDPPAAPAETQKTQITSLPITISSSGSYIVMADLTCTTCAVGSGITVDVDDVTIDLNGFTIRGVVFSLDGIVVTGARSGVAVRNGSVSGWDDDGIDFQNCTNCRAEDLEVSGNSDSGIVVGGTSIVRNVIATANNLGITVVGDDNVIRDSLASGNSTGIEIINNSDDHVVENNVASNNTSIGIDSSGNGSRIEGNSTNSNGSRGMFVVGGENLVIRNSARGNGAGGAFFIGGGNTAGPIETIATPLTNPWANISH